MPKDGTLYNCSGGEIVLPWEFKYSRPELEGLVQIHRYEWIFYTPPVMTASTVATYNHNLSKGVSYIDEAVIFDDGKLLKKLRITSLSRTYSGFMGIRLYFTNILYNLPWEPSATVFGRRSLFNLPGVMHNHSYYKDSAVIRKSNIDRSTVPLLPDYIEDMVQIFITRPPSQTTIKLVARTDYYGFSRAICTSKTAYVGKPPVNLTLFSQGVVLASRSHGGAVTYLTLNVGSQNISCGLTGPALTCVSPSDNRCKRVHLDVSDITGPDDGSTYMDLSFIVYYTETCACLLLLLWVIPLALDHARLVLSLKRNADKQKVRRLSQISLERVTFYEELKQRRMSTNLALKQKRHSILRKSSSSAVPPTQTSNETDFSVESNVTESSV
ncbi:hypothetical protein BsWGS_07476 [Bradybaena similaris]